MQPRKSGRRLSDGFRFALTWPTSVPTPRSSGSPHLSSPTRQGSRAPAPRAWHCSGSRPLRVGTPATGRRSWGSLHLAPGSVCLCAQGRGGACRAGRRTNTAEHTVTGPRAASPPALCLVCSSSRVRGAGGRGGGDSEEVVGGRQKALAFAGGLEPAAKGPDLCAETSSPAPWPFSGLQTRSLRFFPSSYTPWTAPRYSQSRELGLKLIPTPSALLIHPSIHSFIRSALTVRPASSMDATLGFRTM